MSILIKDMEKPKFCYAVIDGETKYCPFVNTDDDCVLQLEKGICEGTWEDQYSKCPLVETSDSCEDAVSRQRLLSDLKELITAWKKYPVMAEQIKGVETAIGYVEAIPPVTPKRKTGRWLIRDGISGAQCSECKMYFKDVYDMDNSDSFCRHCGAKMEGLKVVKDE